MRILAAETHDRMAWKNGGGETIEIAVHPPGADLSGFGWRVSMARVETDRPFSVFAEIDRTLSVLEGEGMALDIAGVGERFLTRESDPLRFPADMPTAARLAGGPILDLNVMTRRGAFDHRVHRLAPSERRSVRPCVGWTLVLAPVPIAVEPSDGAALTLAPLDALLLTASDDPVVLSPGTPGLAFLIEIVPVEASHRRRSGRGTRHGGAARSTSPGALSPADGRVLRKTCARSPARSGPDAALVFRRSSDPVGAGHAFGRCGIGFGPAAPPEHDLDTVEVDNG